MKHFVLIASLLSLFGLAGCVEDGSSPACPAETFGGTAGAAAKKTAFDAWRADAEAAGCVTPIGGKNAGGAASE